MNLATEQDVVWSAIQAILAWAIANPNTALLRVLGVFAIAIALAESAPISATPIQVYGVWHCGSDLCGWDRVRDMTEFDGKNHWLIDRGDGSPSVNLVVLSFVNPLRLLNLTNDPKTADGIPIGMTPEIVSTIAESST